MPQDIALGVSNQSDLFVVRFMFELDVTLCEIGRCFRSSMLFIHFPSKMVIKINRPFWMKIAHIWFHGILLCSQNCLYRSRRAYESLLFRLPQQVLAVS